MDDLISRQAAIDYVDCGHLRPPTELAWSDLDVVDMLKRLLSAEPKTGRWIDTDNYYRRWKCSKCGCHAREDTPYCPFCGRYNGGGE